MPVFVARQPIVDKGRGLLAYELLFRRGGASTAGPIDDGTRATAQLLADGVLVAGLRSITGGAPAFINFTEDLLLGRFADLLTPVDAFVIEVLESVEPRTEILAECERLRRAGYRVALDDVTDTARLAAFHGEFDVVKADLSLCKPADLEEIVAATHAAHALALAEKVEDEAMFASTVALGFDCFQGYALGRPVTMKRKTFSGIPAQRIRLLQVISQPTISLGDLEEVVLADPSLSFKVLAYANSARAAQRGRISSVRQAIVLFGQDEIRHAASLVILSGISDGAPDYLLSQSLVLSHFAEELGRYVGPREDAYRFALVGLLSNLDQLLDVPMADALVGLPLPDDLKDALLGVAGPITNVVRLARSYESGNWDAVVRLVGELEIDGDALPGGFRRAARRAQRLMSA